MEEECPLAADGTSRGPVDIIGDDYKCAAEPAAKALMKTVGASTRTVRTGTVFGC